MKMKRVISIILIMMHMVASVMFVSAGEVPYGTVISENEISTFKPGGWGVGIMRICAYQNHNYVKTSNNTELAFPVYWTGASGDEVYFKGGSSLSDLNTNIYEFATGQSIIDGKSVATWMSEGAKIGISFDWSNNPNDRSFFPLNVPSVIDTSITGVMIESNQICLNTSSLGSGTLWVRAYTDATFNHLVESNAGTVVQYPLSWKFGDSQSVCFGVADGKNESLYDVLTGNFLIDDQKANSHLSNHERWMLCFESTSGNRRWFNYSISKPIIGSATGELINEVSMALHFDQPTNLGEGNLWLRLMTDDSFDGIKRTPEGEPIQFLLHWTGVKGNDIYWQLSADVDAKLTDILCGNAWIGASKINDIMDEDDRFMLCFEDAVHKRTWYEIVDSIIDVPDFYAKTAVVVNDTQVVVEFSDNITVEGAPFLAIRIADKNYKLKWDNGVPIQISGVWQQSKTQPNKLIWTMDTKNQFGIKTVEEATARTGSLDKYSDFSTWFCIEEKPDDGDVEDGTIHNITNTNKQRCYANSIGIGADYDGIYLPLSVNKEYDLSPFKDSNAPDTVVLPILNADGKLTVKRAVAVSATQIVVEFSEPIAFNQKQSNYGPWMTIRAIDETGTPIWGAGPRDDKCIQFTGTYEYLDEHYDRIIWTIDLGSCYDNPSIESIVNYEGDMKQWSTYRIVFYIEEVPYDRDNPGRDYVDNISTADGVYLLSSNNPNPNSSWASTIVDIEIDYSYDLGALIDADKGAQELIVNNLVLPEATDGDNQAAWIPIVTGVIGVGVGVCVTVVVVVMQKRKGVSNNDR